MALAFLKYGKKFITIMAMTLPKMKKKKKSGFEVWERVKKKKKYYAYNIFTINHM